ncbi:hypothetical protein PAMP_012151 [Pampus punctatissimus]
MPPANQCNKFLDAGFIVKIRSGSLIFDSSPSDAVGARLRGEGPVLAGSDSRQTCVVLPQFSLVCLCLSMDGRRGEEETLNVIVGTAAPFYLHLTMI